MGISNHVHLLLSKVGYVTHRLKDTFSIDRVGAAQQVI